MSEEKKNEILLEKLDSSELEAVSGGRGHLFGAAGPGGCTGVWYEETCRATVERWSQCSSNDFCNNNECHYHMH